MFSPEDEELIIDETDDAVAMDVAEGIDNAS